MVDFDLGPQVSCEESTVSEEDLDFAWTLLPSSDLRELSVDLPEHQSAADTSSRQAGVC